MPLFTRKIKNTEPKNKIINKTNSIPKIVSVLAGAIGDTSSNFQKLHQWITNILSVDNSNRMKRYDDYDVMVESSGEIALALSTYADESVQLGLGQDIISIECDDKQFVDYYQDKVINIWKLTESARDTIYNMIKYGDFVSLNIIEKGNGIIRVTPLTNIRKLKNRLELDPKTFRSSGIDRKDPLASEILKILSDRNLVIDKSFYDKFNTYLLGFIIGGDNKGKSGEYVPPWVVNHFRLYTSNDKFFPYGRSFLEDLRSPYKMLMTAMTLMAVMRASRFDRLKHTITLPEGMNNPTKAFEILNEIRTAYTQYLQQTKTDPNKAGLNEDVWSIKDLFETDTIGSSVRYDDISDVEFLRENLLMATRLPKDYLSATSGGALFKSGESLVREDLKVARLIYQFQHYYMLGVIELIKVDMIFNNKNFDPNTVFKLSMPFPSAKHAEDELNNLSDSIRTVNDMMDMLKAMAGLDRDAQLPKETAMMLMTKIMKFDNKTANEILNTIYNIQTNTEPQGTSTGGWLRGSVEFVQEERHFLDSRCPSIDVTVEKEERNLLIERLESSFS